jgi:hypothetical protein
MKISIGENNNIWRKAIMKVACIEMAYHGEKPRNGANANNERKEISKSSIFGENNISVIMIINNNNNHGVIIKWTVKMSA